MKPEPSMFDRKGERKYLNWPEREAFLAGVMKERNAMKQTFYLTLLYTGCRISEALNLSWDRVDLGEQALVFRTLKQRNNPTYRSVPIPERLLNELGGLWYPGAFDSLVWPWSRAKGYRLIKEVMDRAELTGIKASPKGLRHSFAVACISRGIPLTTVKKWMGHARLETTAIYLDFIGEEEREQARLLWKDD